MIKRFRERGLSVPAVLFVLAVLMIMGTSFMFTVRFQTQQAGLQQAKITAGYVAEIGFNQMRAQLAKYSGDWTQIPGMVSDCEPLDPYKDRCQHVPETNNKAQFIKVRENPLDANSPIIGIYEAKIETGQKRALFGGKTVTGASLGYVPGTSESDEKKGYDRFGNLLCDIADEGCPGKYMGIQVTAWLTKPNGEILPKSASQNVYGVIEIGTGNNEDSPAGYLLDSDDPIEIRENTIWDEAAKAMQIKGGFYGPVHTNQEFTFKWISLDDLTLTRYTPANTLDPIPTPAPPDIVNRTEPFTGVLQIDRGIPPLAVSVYQPGTDFYYAPPNYLWYINWGLPGAEPAVGTSFGVTNSGAGTTFNYTHAALNGSDLVFAPGGIASVEQGATTYNQGSDYTESTQAFIDWNVPGGNEPAGGKTYNVRFIHHNPIHIFGKMTYAGGAPKLRYLHEHGMSGGWPLYQQAHGHNNVAGADFAANSVGGPDGIAKYDGTSWRHEHDISTDLIDSPPSPNTFLTFDSAGFKPLSSDYHYVPLLKPIPAGSDPGLVNYKNQLEQLNKYLQLTLGISLPRNPDGSLDASSLPSGSDYAMGYLVGDGGQSPPNVTVFDFRAVYFGNDLHYSAGASSGSPVLAAGSPITDEKFIWVNENDGTSDYMKVAATQIDSNYHKFLYKQIPPSQVLLVRDAVVKIGNMKPKSPIVNCQAAYADCLDTIDPANPTHPTGEATIVDGRLSIVSFTTNAPAQEHMQNKGDIVIGGNVVYRNSVAYDGALIRQLDPHPVSPYTRSRTVNPPISSLTDTQVMWVTNTDGTRFQDVNGDFVGNLNGLGLFATQDIKISVNSLFYDEPTEDAGSHDDMIRVYGELIAGNRIYVHAKDSSGNPMSDLPDHVNSADDELVIFGTMYSRIIPDFTSYFEKKRTYLYDRSLFMNPLIGAPFYPKAAGDYRNQTIFNNFPRLVNGTWKQGIMR